MHSDRLEYKKWTYDDFDALKEILGNPKVCEFLPGNKDKTEEDITKWLHHFIRTFKDEFNTQTYAVYLKDTDTIIGYGGLGYLSEFNEIEIMYGFNEKYWGKGYATEVSLRMKELAKELRLNFLVALADIGNVPSQKILLKTGFRQIKQIEIWGINAYYYEMNL